MLKTSDFWKNIKTLFYGILRFLIFIALIKWIGYALIAYWKWLPPH
jgi:hypothetical protein